MHIGAQELFYDWCYTMRPYYGVNSTGMVSDNVGNSYVIEGNSAYVNDTINGSKETSRGYVGRILKIDTGGKLVWERVIRPVVDAKNPYFSNGMIYLIDIELSSDGNLIVIGNLDGKAVFPSEKKEVSYGNEKDPSNVYNGLSGFIASYDSSGELIWLTETSYLNIYDRIHRNHAGKLFLKTTYDADLTIGKQLVQKVLTDRSGPKHYSILELSSNGKYKKTAFHWEEIPCTDAILPTNHLENFDITFDKKDNMILYGQCVGTLELSESTKINCNQRYYDARAAFIAKYSPQGELLWQKKIGGRGSFYKVVDPVFNENNELYFAGTFTTDCIISDGAIQSVPGNYKRSRSGASFMYGKISETGELLFVKYRMQPHEFTHVDVAAMAIDKLGNVHITGDYNDSLQFGTANRFLFPGTKTTVDTFRYEGRLLSSTHVEYKTCFYYSVWNEDSLLHLQNLADYEGYGYGTLVESMFITDNQLVFCGKHASYATYVHQREGKTKLLESGKGSLILAKVSLPVFKEALDTVSDTPVETIPIASLPTVTKHDIAVDNPEKNTSAQPAFVQNVMPLKVRVFPNPFTNEISILPGRNEENVLIELREAQGRLIYSQQIDQLTQSEPHKLIFDQLAAGDYFLEVSTARAKQHIHLIRVN